MPRKFLAPIMALAVVIALTACATAASPSTTPPSPTGPPSSGSPTPSESPTPRDAPEPTDSPPSDTGIDIPGMGRVTRAVEAIGMVGGGMPVASLAGGDAVRIQMGPLHLAGTEWYMVSGTQSEWMGWIPVDALAYDGPPETSEIVAAIHGDGSGSADEADVEAGAQLMVHVVAAPRSPGDTCEIDIVVITPDGDRVQVNGVSEIDAPTTFFQSPLENSGLRVASGGSATLQVRTDCTFAGTLTALPA